MTYVYVVGHTHWQERGEEVPLATLIAPLPSGTLVHHRSALATPPFACESSVVDIRIRFASQDALSKYTMWVVQGDIPEPSAIETTLDLFEKYTLIGALSGKAVEMLFE